MGQFLLFSPHHPDYNPAKHPGFEECYRLVRSVICPIEGHLPPAIILNQGGAKKCALCDSVEGEVTFDKEAHTVPAAFGNRHHTSEEECGACNQFYGIEYEQHLALIHTLH